MSHDMIKIKELSIWVALPLLLAVTACGTGGRNYKLHKLRSGKTVRILSVMQVNFPNSGPALMLKYETDLDLNDRDKLQEEVSEIWEDFRLDAERANVQGAIISANSVPKGTFIKRGQAYNFIFERRADGRWGEVTGKG